MYLIIILVVMFADIGLAIWGSISSGSLSLLEAILYPILVLLYVLLMIGLLDIILRIFPKSMYDYKKRYLNILLSLKIIYYNSISNNLSEIILAFFIK